MEFLLISLGPLFVKKYQLSSSSRSSDQLHQESSVSYPGLGGIHGTFTPLRKGKFHILKVREMKEMRSKLDFTEKGIRK